MFYGLFSVNGTGRLVRVEGIMKKDQYVNILRVNLEKSAKALNKKSGMMFQRNDLNDTAKSVKNSWEIIR